MMLHVNSASEQLPAPVTGQSEITPIHGRLVQVFDRLVQYYEAEFSAITGKTPDQSGQFALDTRLDDSHRGYLLSVDGSPAGFSVIALKGEYDFEICEFYILPVYRARQLGYRLAADGFDRHRGAWEVKQIAGADQATRFWRKTISRYTAGAYAEDIFQDGYWGTVTRQRFSNG